MGKTKKLRQRAEEELRKAEEKGNIPVNISELVHELQVHQIELQMQNEELRKSQEETSNLYNQYHELYDYAPVGYFSLDKDGNIKNINIKGAELLKLEKKRIIGRGFVRFIQNESRNDYFNLLTTAINTGKTQSLELQLKGNKNFFYGYMEIMPIYNKFNEKYRITVTDITKRKKAEEELKLAHENLEKQVSERTVELKNAVKELKESNDELQQFAYVSSHDLQEPLRTVASFTQLLERRYKGKLDSDADEFIEYIVDATIRMKQQIQDLLEFSRVTTNKEKFKLIDLNEILNQTMEYLHDSIKKSKTEITHDKLPIVVGNGGQLQRVFQNLISNAIKFRKCEEPLKISISAYKDENANEYVFSIKDNGIGIEEQYFERIFTIFQQLHTREEYHGTGIGLSIVKRIIERHNGRIWVESEFGEGSTFYFTIPIKE
ncbi:ATP-binding protein [Methanobacterium sp.]|uniref:sensor histidine kinase n=1 Tax=Methanobacterium sp. TaxID=2164 RepID=UPI003157FC5D